MFKRILIPTDFNIESLNTLKRALDGLGDTEVHIVLMYSEYISQSITDLLFYSPETKRNDLLTPAFKEALNILKNRYEKNILSIRVEFFHGYGVSAFKNFLEGHKIDLIFVPKYYQLSPPKNGFDPIPIIKKSKIPYYEMGWEASIDTVKTHLLSFLFS